MFQHPSFLGLSLGPWSALLLVSLMVFGVLCRLFLSVVDIKLLCDVFKWTRLIWRLHVWCFVVARVLVFWWSVFLFGTELDGGQKAGSSGIISVWCRGSTFSESEMSLVVGWFGLGGGSDCSGISTALCIQARQRRLANPLSPTL